MKKTAILSVVALLQLAGCAFKTPPEDYKSANPAMADPVKAFASVAESTTLPPAVYGNWQGSLPCADCEGITYYLTFQKDKTFRESSEYLGKNAPPVVENGTWMVNSDSVVQLIKPSGKRYLIMENQNLVLLDLQGQRVTSELAEKYILTRPGKNGANGTNNLETLRQAGVDFMATGSNWTLEIDSEKAMTFRSQNNNIQLVSEVPTVQQLPGGRGSVYRGITKAGTLAVRILNQPCSDKTSGQTIPQTVEVTANAQEFTGCGQFLNANPLQGTWELQEMNGKALKASDFQKALPFLEIPAEPKRVAGTGGCNRISGEMNLKENQLTFGNLISTRMACPGPAMQFESSYLGLISNKTFSYLLEADKLTLQENDKPVLVYRKAE